MGRLVFGFQSVVMRRLAVPAFAVLLGASAVLAPVGAARAQEQKAATSGPTPAEVAREGQKRADEFVEATQAINGPAGNPECVWLGRRVVVLMWRDDLDTAFRHLDLYDRFGCPGAHIQATFRCLVRQGNIDPKAQETLNGRVHACWLNPGLEPVAAEAAPAPAATSGGTAKP